MNQKMCKGLTSKVERNIQLNMAATTSGTPAPVGTRTSDLEFSQLAFRHLDLVDKTSTLIRSPVINERTAQFTIN